MPTRKASGAHDQDHRHDRRALEERHAVERPDEDDEAEAKAAPATVIQAARYQPGAIIRLPKPVALRRRGKAAVRCQHFGRQACLILSRAPCISQDAGAAGAAAFRSRLGPAVEPALVSTTTRARIVGVPEPTELRADDGIGALALVGSTRTVVVMPGTASFFRRNSGTQKEWSTSFARILNRYGVSLTRWSSPARLTPSSRSRTSRRTARR